MRATLFLLLFGFNLHADLPADFKIRCATNSALVTVASDGDSVRFRMEDGQGFNGFPFYSGAVTLPMLPLIQRASVELKVFGGVMEARWPQAACERDPASPLLIRCGIGGQITIPLGTEFKLTSLGTWTEQVQGFGLQATVLNIFVGLDTPPKNYTHYFVNFPFDQNRCAVNAN